MRCSTLAAFAVSACAVTSVPVGPLAAPRYASPPLRAVSRASLPDLDYTFRHASGATPVVDVTARAAADPSGPTTFTLEHFAAVSDPENWICDVHARIVGGGALAIDPVSPHTWRGRAPAVTQIAIEYQMLSSQGSSDACRFRAAITSGFVHFLTRRHETLRRREDRDT